MLEKMKHELEKLEQQYLNETEYLNEFDINQLIQMLPLNYQKGASKWKKPVIIQILTRGINAKIISLKRDIIEYNKKNPYK
jgi:hypothetical protein